MATSVHKLTGQPATITWQYNVADESLITHFRVDSSPLGMNTWAFEGSIQRSDRVKVVISPGASVNYRVSAVSANGLESAGNLVELIIDQLPPPAPTNVEIS